jgi:hypothetical protein
MTLANLVIYFLLALGIVLVVLGVVVLARQLLSQSTMKSVATGAQASYLSALVIVIGIAGLGTSAFLSLRKPASSVPAPTASITPAPTKSAASPATPSTSPPVPGSPSSSPVPTGSVTLSAPPPGSGVQQCDVFTGTSSLPASETIVVGVRNLDDNGDTSYLAPVSNWNKPGALAHWIGIQYFGSGNASVGQTYLVSVIVMPSGVVKSALAEPANQTAWAVTALPSGSTVKQSLHLNRVAGLGPAQCR